MLGSGLPIHDVGGSTVVSRVRYTGIDDRTEAFRSSPAQAVSTRSSSRPTEPPHNGQPQPARQPSQFDGTTAAIRVSAAGSEVRISNPSGSPGLYPGPTDGGVPTVVFGFAPSESHQENRSRQPMSPPQ